MKRIIFVSLFITFVQVGFAQGRLDPSLLETMNQVVEDHPIEVVAIMKAQYDRQQLCQRAEFVATRAARRDYVVQTLKAFTEASQHDLKHTLAEMELQGMVSSVHSLWSANALYFTASKEALMQLSERPDIELISLNKQYQWIPEEELAVEASSMREITPNLTQVHADQVWAQGNRGQGVVIAVIDSGVNYNHRDLADHLWDGGPAFPHHGYDIVNDDDDPMDDLGHGTHCAGTVCGDGTAGAQTGVAPEATLMCIKSIRSDGFGGAVNIAGGMEWAVEHGCDAFSMSLGMVNAEVADKEILRRSCEAILDAGVLGLVCAGNEGHIQFYSPIPNNIRVPASCPPPYLDPDQLANPGGLTCIMAVGAVDDNDAAAYFTSQGPVTWQDTRFGDYAYNPGIGLIRPDVCAPGVSIKSLDYNNPNGYTELSGTSQATPCVAGIVALMLSKNPELRPEELCRILEESSVRLTPTKSNLTGVGRVDALAAVDRVPDWDNNAEQKELPARVSPNPSQGPITIQCEGMTQIDVYSTDGKQVHHVMTETDSHLLEGLKKGLYLLKITTDRGTVTKKIVQW